jgi:hypothetical protein
MKHNLDPGSLIRSELIAPCGMNCAVCMGRLLREDNKCPGCRAKEGNKPRNCARCVIVNCETLRLSDSKFCSEKCVEYPCKRLMDLDKRYREKYDMSMLENLHTIQEIGIRAFIKHERTRWSCNSCGGVICVHRGYCIVCGAPR